MTTAKLKRFPRSTVWDKQTQRAVDGVRAFMHREPPPTISHIQNESVKARLLKGPFQATQEALPAPPEDDVKLLLFRVIAELGEAEYERPELASVPVEWIINSPSTRPAERPESTDSWVKSDSDDLTILHAHGGAFFQGSPMAYRPTTTQLAKTSGGRVVSIDYRLAPQNPFPAALLDMLVAYLSLLHPDPNSHHTPLDPSQIVFAGDSAGGVLLYNLLQIIQHTANYEPIKFNSTTIRFPLPAPAGIATQSLAGEMLFSLPAHWDNLVNDIHLDVPWYSPRYPSCGLWPTKPPRPEIYATTKTFDHPLLTLATHQSWRGSPPMWFSVGEEQLIDGSKVVARKAVENGIDVTWIEFEAMPHCFPMLPVLNRSRQAQFLFVQWGKFCRECVDRKNTGGQIVEATQIGFKDAEQRPVKFDGKKILSQGYVRRRVCDRVQEIEKEFAFMRSRL